MLKSYFKTAIRNLWKNKTYSFLNIAGLAVGIACAALIFLWVEDELSFNDYFTNQKNIYKVKDRQTYDGSTFVFDATPGPMALAMKTEIPGIKNTARSTWGNRLLFSLDDKAIYEQGLYVDSGFLSIFQLQFLKGSASKAFNELYSIVVSEKMAKKFFGSTDVVGKTLKVDNDHEYAITGVLKDLPENVSLKFEWLASFKLYEEQNLWLQQWGSNGVITYLQTDPHANIDAINKKLYNYVATKGDGLEAKMSIYPMSRWRLYDNYDANGNEIAGRVKYVRLFSLIAWIILVIACINFMNLATARSEKRSKEVGMRKVLGAGKSKLISQFIGESLVMAFISALFAIALLYLTMPAFDGLVDKQLSVNLFQPVHIGSLLLISILCGLIAGSYPAFYLSSFNPLGVLKGIKLKNGSASMIRKGLVIAQFSISVVLIISTIIIYQQIQHVKDRDLGYNKRDLVYLNLTGKIKEHFNVIKNDLLQTGTVQNASLSSNTVLQLGSNTGDFTWEGRDPSKQVLITVEYVSPEYVSTMGMRLKEGRDFYTDAKTDTNNVIINESLARILNRKNVVGSVIGREGGTKYTIVGVINDFVYNNMYSPSAPLILFSDTSAANFLTVRFKPGNSLSKALANLTNVVKRDNPGYPVEYKFIDEQFEQFFKTETLIGRLSAVFAVLAVIICCLGLFGLSAFTAEQRIKEIGIRKVLGATVSGITALLSMDFLKLVLISFVVAFPLAWYLMHKWLQSYAYRISISWLVFAGAGLVAVLIALFTISFQAVRAAVANPVKSLRTE